MSSAAGRSSSSLGTSRVQCPYFPGALGHTVSAQPPEGLETEVSHAGSRPGLRDRKPDKDLGHRGWGLPWLATVLRAVISGPAELTLPATPRGEGGVDPPGPCPGHPFPWLIAVCVLSLRQAGTVSMTALVSSGSPSSESADPMGSRGPCLTSFVVNCIRSRMWGVLVDDSAVPTTESSL